MSLTLRDFLALHPLLRVVLSLVVGILTAHHLRHTVSLRVWLMLVAVTLVLAALSARRAHLQGMFLLLGTLFAGAWLYSWHSNRQKVAWPSASVTLQGVVIDVPTVRQWDCRCDFMVQRVGEKELPRPLRLRAFLPLDDALSPPHTGQTLMVQGFVRPPAPLTALPHMDYVQWMAVQGYVGTLMVQHWKFSTTTTPLPWLTSLRLHLLLLRQKLLERLSSLPLSTEAEALLAAMTLGDHSALSPSIRQDWAVAGGSHLLALSGLHLGMVFGCLSMLLGRRRRQTWWGQILILLTLWGYVFLVALPISAVRAALMLSGWSLSQWSERRATGLNALLLAALLILLVQPLTLWDVGFQLSFAAVAALQWWASPLQRWAGVRNPLIKKVWGLIVMSITAQAATAPLVMFHFGRFSTWFLPTNLVAVPLATLLVYGTLLLLLFWYLPLLQSVMASVLGKVAEVLSFTLSSIAHWPWASCEELWLHPWQVVLIYMGMIALTIMVHVMAKVKGQHKLEAFWQRQNGEEKTVY